MAEVHINGLAFIFYDDIALREWLDTYMKRINKESVIIKYMQAQQEAEDQGKEEFICPVCGGMARWRRCEENHHLYTECSICGIAIYDLPAEKVCKDRQNIILLAKGMWKKWKLRKQSKSWNRKRNRKSSPGSKSKKLFL